MPGPTSKRIGIYARVSTQDQCPDNQLIPLRKYCNERGWTIQGEFIDHGVSGATEKRPALNLMMDAARKRQIDTILVWKFDRFARSVKHLVVTLEELVALSVGFVSYTENFDTTSAWGKTILVVIGSMAELERSLCQQRIVQGMARARSQNIPIGRPHANIDAVSVHKLRNEGISVRSIAQQLGIPRSTLMDFLKSERGHTEIQKFQSLPQ